MRFGLCTGNLEVLRQLASWGYDYAEIGGSTVVPFEDDRAFAPIRTELLEIGVPIEALAGFVPGSVPVIGPTVDQAQILGYLETTIGRAADVGVKVVNWGSVVSRRVPDGWPMSKAWDQIERVAALIADIAAKSGVTIAVEAVNPREANILFYLTEALNLVRTVDRTNLRLNVDYYHLVKQNEPPEHLTAAAPFLAHAHTSDDNRGFPGLGAWDQKPFLQSLKAGGYDGRLSFEVRGTFNPQFAEDAQRSVRLMRRLQAEVEGETNPTPRPSP
ncbi:MAG TPA: sugar phosphate isomerase/epimerase family protein [Chloroflexota bacterium]|nr:sugar phosphate isomerase/epimerase family protein [Chloroflexota bacterium]